MDRLTTENPMTNSGLLLNFAYAGEDHRVKLRNGGADVDLCDYISEAAAIDHGSCGISSDSVMEGACMECDLFECPSGALCFAATQAAELRGRLKRIEDILGDTYDLDHLRELLTAEREGRLYVRPPIQVGDTLYLLITTFTSYEMREATITGFRAGKNFQYVSYRFNQKPYREDFVRVDDLGKIAFLSHEEAEAALAKMKEEV